MEWWWPLLAARVGTQLKCELSLPGLVPFPLPLRASRAEHGLTLLPPAEHRLNREITSFVSYISPTPTEHATRSHIIALIRQAVVGQWRDAEVSPFGSYETGLYLPTG